VSGSHILEQALLGEVTSTTTLDLVLQYVEALRAARLNLNADDMLRAASITATEAVREGLVPREIEHAYLRGVLVKEADGMTFMNAKNDKPGIRDGEASHGPHERRDVARHRASHGFQAGNGGVENLAATVRSKPVDESHQICQIS
jgi:hypothetical protein